MKSAASYVVVLSTWDARAFIEPSIAELMELIAGLLFGLLSRSYCHVTSSRLSVLSV